MKWFGKSVVRSFDLFDTLIARRCKEPFTVFEIVESRSGFRGFAEARKKAEQRAQLNSEYTIDTIYGELRALLDLSQDDANRLKSIEIAVEIEEAVPIAKNIRLVRDGDIVVSDMYLPADVLRKMLGKAGVRKNVEIFVSARGKRTGAIWKRIRRRYHVASHLGDNVYSDFRSATRRMIPARITKVSRFSDAERMLAQMGLEALALVARQARLSLWHEDWLMRRLQHVQADLNLPLLVLASLQLMDVVSEVGATRVLFCSRDGNLWISLFEKMRKALDIEVKAEYFYTSRPARLNCSRDYQAYCRERFDHGTLVVDIGGTGWSLSCLMDTLGMPAANCFFLHHIPQLPSLERLRQSKDNVRIYSLLSKDEKMLRNAVLEMCNYANHPSVLDVQLGGGEPKPVLMPETRSEEELRAVAVQREAFLSAVEAVSESALRPLKEVASETRKAASVAIYRSLMDERALSFMFQKAHSAEDRAILVRMGAASRVVENPRSFDAVVGQLKRRIRRFQLRFGLG